MTYNAYKNSLVIVFSGNIAGASALLSYKKQCNSHEYRYIR